VDNSKQQQQQQKQISKYKRQIIQITNKDKPPTDNSHLSNLRQLLTLVAASQYQHCQFRMQNKVQFSSSKKQIK